jgi:hypothetical protein
VDGVYPSRKVRRALGATLWAGGGYHISSVWKIGGFYFYLFEEE